jgi:hypothetical protein
MKKNPTTMQNADRFVHAIFCDDIRQEIGNKVSFMGCYQGELFVPFVPLMLPKLCVQVTVATTVERPLKALTVRLDQGTNQLAVIEISGDELARAIPPATEDKTRLAASVGVMLAPFTITEPGELRVVVITEEGEMPGPRLRIKLAPQTEATADVVAALPTDKEKPKAAAKKAGAKRGPIKKA